MSNRNSTPFPTLLAEAAAIERFADGDLAKTVGSYDLARLAVIASDARKKAAELRLLAFSHSYSPIHYHEH